MSKDTCHPVPTRWLDLIRAGRGDLSLDEMARAIARLARLAVAEHQAAAGDTTDSIRTGANGLAPGPAVPPLSRAVCLELSGSAATEGDR